MEGKNTIWWVVGAIVLLAIGIFFWWNSQQSPAATPSQNTTTQGTTAQPIPVESRSNSTVAEVAASLSDGGQFAALFASSGVAASLTGSGPYTVFIPTDGAMAALAPGTISDLTAAQKKRLVQYHVVKGKMLDIDAVSSGQNQALSGDVLNFNVDIDSKQVQVNSAYGIQAYRAKNGIVYLVGGVLIPPQKTQ